MELPSIKGVVLPVAFFLMGGCGSHPPSVHTANSHTPETGVSEDDALANLRSLDEIRTQRLCIAPGVCEDLSEWRPSALLVLDGSLIAVGTGHAFVRVENHWNHFSVPVGAPELFDNGHAAFFCGPYDGVFELTKDGIRQRATLPYWVRECNAAFASGDELFVVTDDGVVLRSEGDQWIPLDFEFHYGNGYGSNTIAMSRAHAYLVDRACAVLEVPSEGPDFEPHRVAETGFDSACTIRVVDAAAGVPKLLVQGSTGIALIDGAQVQHLTYPPAPTVTGAQSAEIAEISEALNEGPPELAGVSPLMVQRARVLDFDGEATFTLEVVTHIWEDGTWRELAPAQMDLFHLAVLGAGADTDRAPREAAVAYGPFSVVLAHVRHERDGPSVIATRRDGVDTVLTAFNSPPLLAEDTDASATMTALGNAASPLFTATGPQGSGFTDAAGFHPMRVPAGQNVLRIYPTPNGNAYVVTDRVVHFLERGALRPLPGSEALGPSTWTRLGNDYLVLVRTRGLVRLRGSEMRELALTEHNLPQTLVQVGHEEIAALAANGTTWLIRHGEVSEVSSPAPATHVQGPQFLSPPASNTSDAWSLAFSDRWTGSGTKYVVATPQLRTLGSIDSIIRPFSPPVVVLPREDDVPYDSQEFPDPLYTEEGFQLYLSRCNQPQATREENETRIARAQREGTAAYCQRALVYGPPIIVADPSMRNVTFVVPSSGRNVRFVDRVEAEHVDGEISSEETRARIITMWTQPRSAIQQVVNMRANHDPRDTATVIPSGPREGQIVHARLLAGNTLVLEIVDRANRHATEIFRERFTRAVELDGTFAIARDGSTIAFAFGLAQRPGESGSHPEIVVRVVEIPNNNVISWRYIASGTYSLSIPLRP